MEKLIEVKNLNMYYPIKDGLMGNLKGYVYALNEINIDIYKNEILGLVGESGSGKSTLGNCILKLITPTSGEILYKSKNILYKNKNAKKATGLNKFLRMVDLKKYKVKQNCIKRIIEPEYEVHGYEQQIGQDDKAKDFDTGLSDIKEFRKEAQIVFQNPYMSLNPRMKIYDILKEPFIIHGLKDKGIINKKIEEILSLTGMQKDTLYRYPHEFSGGQRQRIAIARAIILNPEFIVADEPVSALDVSIQAQIINLLINLKRHLNLTMLFISHDLSVVKYISDRIAVMYLGEIVEIADKKTFFDNYKHPYSEALLNAVPTINTKREKPLLKGDIPSPQTPPKGCKFHTRCPYKMTKCMEEHPELNDYEENHKVRCFLYCK